MVSASASDASALNGAGDKDDYDHNDDHAWRDHVPGGINRRRSLAYANGMFILIRATSVSCTTADFAMWRFSFPLLEESKCRREAC